VQVGAALNHPDHSEVVQGMIARRVGKWSTKSPEDCHQCAFSRFVMSLTVAGNCFAEKGAARPVTDEEDEAQQKIAKQRLQNYQTRRADKKLLQAHAQSLRAADPLLTHEAATERARLELAIPSSAHNREVTAERTKLAAIAAKQIDRLSQAAEVALSPWEADPTALDGASEADTRRALNAMTSKYGLLLKDARRGDCAVPTELAPRRATVGPESVLGKDFAAAANLLGKMSSDLETLGRAIADPSQAVAGLREAAATFFAEATVRTAPSAPPPSQPHALTLTPTPTPHQPPS